MKITYAIGQIHLYYRWKNTYLTHSIGHLTYTMGDFDLYYWSFWPILWLISPILFPTSTMIQVHLLIPTSKSRQLAETCDGNEGHGGRGRAKWSHYKITYSWTPGIQLTRYTQVGAMWHVQHPRKRHETESKSKRRKSPPSSILNLTALVVLTSLKFLPLSLCSEMTKVSTHFIPAQWIRHWSSRISFLHKAGRVK